MIFCLTVYRDMAYLKFNVTLTDNQLKSLSHAVQTKSPLNLKLSLSQLEGGPHTLGLTKRQIQHIDKNRQKGMGSEIRLSKSQVTKQGGFLGALLNLAKAVAPSLVKIATAGAEGLVSGLATKAVSGGCVIPAYVVPHLQPYMHLFTPEQKSQLDEVSKVGSGCAHIVPTRTQQRGGFIIPILASLVGSLLPELIRGITGKGLQIAQKN